MNLISRGYIDRNSCEFPEDLRENMKDLKGLYYTGDIELLSKRGVAVVGTRKCSQYGIWAARKLTELLALNDVAVISGLALGIDREAHSSCLNSKGKTIAVLGNGLDVYYPAKNSALQKKIEKEGLIISEYADGTPPKRYSFPRRNGIIAAIAERVVIVEAPIKSGAVLTCEMAIEMNKEVYAIPGNINSILSQGCNKIIKDGGNGLFFLQDILTDMKIEPIISNVAYFNLTEKERIILKTIQTHGEVSLDEIFHITNIKISELSAIISILEIKGLLFVEMGKIFVV